MPGRICATCFNAIHSRPGSIPLTKGTVWCNKRKKVMNASTESLSCGKWHELPI